MENIQSRYSIINITINIISIHCSKLIYCLFIGKHHRKKNNIDNIEEEMKKFTINEPEEQEKPVKKTTKVSFN